MALFLPILDSLLWSVPLPRLRHSRMIWILTASWAHFTSVWDSSYQIQC